MRLSGLLLSLTAALPLGAQTQSSSPSAAPPPIEDNSFLVEEAYNQERGIVQHVSTFARSAGSSAWVYEFAQEWPLAGQKHQVSYTLPLAHTAEPLSSATGIGDIALNYRYQIGGGDGASLALAPSATLVLPTGDSRRGMGAGGTGFELKLPLSVEISPRLVAHSNAGISYTPRARDTFGNTAAARGYALGQSLIWLAHPNLNLMLESVWSVAREVTGPGQTAPSTEFLVAPGLRTAINLRSGLQIVPGLAFPIGVGASRGERAVFAYLSFEHPFARQSP
jgi:hypothetical protein